MADRGWRRMLSGSGKGTAKTEWIPLPHPVPGHSTIDGIPVPVVAVRRDSDGGRLEVVRGYHPTEAWPSRAAPAGSKLHILPASSFIPHPRRELQIRDQRYFYSTVANSARCTACGATDIGFGFVSSEVPLDGGVANPADHSMLCERCAESLAAPAV